MQIKDIQERIGYFRTKLNLSARELSLRIGKHGAYIAKFESGGFHMPIDVLLQIIEELKISPKHFFADNYHNFEADNELYEVVKSLPIEKKQHLLGLFKR